MTDHQIGSFGAVCACLFAVGAMITFGPGAGLMSIAGMALFMWYKAMEERR